MNNYFKTKIIDIKESLPKPTCDPLGKLKELVGNKQLTCRIQTIAIKEAKLVFKRSNPKMSSGITGIPKKLVCHAHEILAVPFQRIFIEREK